MAQELERSGAAMVATLRERAESLGAELELMGQRPEPGQVEGEGEVGEPARKVKDGP